MRNVYSQSEFEAMMREQRIILSTPLSMVRKQRMMLSTPSSFSSKQQTSLFTTKASKYIRIPDAEPYYLCVHCAKAVSEDGWHSAKCEPTSKPHERWQILEKAIATATNETCSLIGSLGSRYDVGEMRNQLCREQTFVPFSLSEFVRDPKLMREGPWK
jgi:hypothetical protein